MVGDSAAGNRAVDGEPTTGTFFWEKGRRHGHGRIGPLAAKVPRVLFRLGNDLHLLVSPHGSLTGALARVPVHVSDFVARQYVLHQDARQQMVDADAGSSGVNPRNLSCFQQCSEPVADVFLWVRRSFRGHANARSRIVSYRSLGVPGGLRRRSDCRVFTIGIQQNSSNFLDSNHGVSCGVYRGVSRLDGNVFHGFNQKAVCTRSRIRLTGKEPQYLYSELC